MPAGSNRIIKQLHFHPAGADLQSVSCMMEAANSTPVANRRKRGDSAVDNDVKIK